MSDEIKYKMKLEDETEIDVIPADEVKKLEEKHKAELDAVKTDLEKLQGKDLNFKKLREMNEEEKADLTSKERNLLERQEKLEEEQKTFREQVTESYKNEASAVLVGDDEELRKKTLYHYGRIMGDTATKDDVYKKMREASLLAKGEGAVGVSPVYSAMGYQGSPPNKMPKAQESEDSKEMREKFKISDEEKKKFGADDWKPKFK